MALDAYAFPALGQGLTKVHVFMAQPTGLNFNPTTRMPARSPAVSAKFSIPAHQKLVSYTLAHPVTMSELLRELVRLGWGVAFGEQLDVPPGVSLPFVENPAEGRELQEVGNPS